MIEDGREGFGQGGAVGDIRQNVGRPSRWLGEFCWIKEGTIGAFPSPSHTHTLHTLSPWAQHRFIFGWSVFQDFASAFSQMHILYLRAGSFSCRLLRDDAFLS